MKYKITPTKHSLGLVEYISENMEGGTFHHHFHILYDIRNSIEKDEVNFLEIGTHYGASSCLMLSNPKKTNVCSIDLPYFPCGDADSAPNYIQNNVIKFGLPQNNFNLILGNSRDKTTINEVKEKLSSVDILFIDGDHSYDAIIDDFLNYKDLLNNGGYIIFDDYHDHSNPIVKHAVDYIVDELLFDDYEVIGFFRNKLNAKPNGMIYNNEFILRKK